MRTTAFKDISTKMEISEGHKEQHCTDVDPFYLY